MLGVGGRVDDASNNELAVGQDGYVGVPASVCKGELMKVTLEYSCWSKRKSEEVVTVDPSAEIVTIPN